MEKNSYNTENKNNTIRSSLDPANAQKMSRSQTEKTAATGGLSKTMLTSISMDDKMSYAAQLRQQFVEEIKDIELTLKVCETDKYILFIIKISLPLAIRYSFLFFLGFD